MTELTLKMATGNYGHTMPLKDGTITSERVGFDHVEVPVIINAFRRMIRDLEFDVTGPIVRCLATHANPDTGERDLDVMQTLTREFDQARPTMGVLAVPRTAGTIAVGDEVTPI